MTATNWMRSLASLSFLALSFVQHGARAEPLTSPYLYSYLDIAGLHLHGSVDLRLLDKALRRPSSLVSLKSREGEFASVSDCRDWLLLSGKGYVSPDNPRTSGIYPLIKMCPPLMFLGVASKHGTVRGKSPHAPVILPEQLPAYILPSIHTFVPQYTEYRNQENTYEALVENHLITIISLGAVSIFKCNEATEIECSGMTQTIEAVASGDFLRLGRAQILISARSYYGSDDGNNDTQSVYFILYLDQEKRPSAVLLDPSCKDEMFRNLQDLRSVACPTTPLSTP